METGNIAVFSLPVFPSAVTVGTAVAKTTTCLSLANKTKQTKKKNSGLLAGPGLR